MAGRPLGAENKDKRFKAALIRYADADPRRLDELAKTLWDTAAGGDVTATREIADRLDGKVPQGIEAPAGSSGKLVIEWNSGDSDGS